MDHVLTQRDYNVTTDTKKSSFEFQAPRRLQNTIKDQICSITTIKDVSTPSTCSSSNIPLPWLSSAI